MTTTSHSTRTLGTTGPEVSSIGLGLMGMSDLYGPADENESIATIHAALDAGVTLLDTGDFYGMGHNELLLRDALRGRRRDDVVISVKFGALRDPAGGWSGSDTRPVAIKNFLAYTLRRLGTDHVDIYRPARLDPTVPVEDTVGALAELVEQGYVRHIGLSEVGAETLRRASAVHPISDLQIEYSLDLPGHRGRDPAHGPGAGRRHHRLRRPLARPAVGSLDSPTARARDFRSHLPRFTGENLERNLALVEALRAVAEGAGATVAQVAVAWVLSRGEDVVPLVGARRRDRLAESLGATGLALSSDDLATIEAAVPADAVAGTRYDSAQMAFLDSERS